jgi:hypothetical protein
MANEMRDYLEQRERDLEARVATLEETLSRDPLRRAFRNADASDWDQLIAMVPDSGYGKFWQAVLSEARAALAK